MDENFLVMGRRSAFVLMRLIYSAFTLAGAFAPSAAWPIVLRFFAGIGADMTPSGSE